MSAWGTGRPYAPSFEELVSAIEQWDWDIETEHFGGFEVNRQLLLIGAWTGSSFGFSRRKSKLIALLTSVGKRAASLETRTFSGEFAKVGKLCRRHSRSTAIDRRP
jgi:hypothetical protein